METWQEARALVRGGFADERRLNLMIQCRLDFRNLSPAERGQYAALLIQGFVASEKSIPHTRVVWHRSFGDTRVRVGVSG